MAGRVTEKELQPVLDDIAVGESLRTACSKKGRPTMARCLYAIQKDAVLFEQYARARERRADVLAEECIEIADTEPDPQKARVRVDARKWYASKVNKTYADKQEVTVKNVDLTEEELDRRIADLAKKVGITK